MWLVSLVAILYVCASELAHALPRYELSYSWYRGEQEDDIKVADNFTTTHPSWRGQVGDYRSGYELFRIEGRVFHRDVEQPPGTVPLFGWYISPEGFRAKLTSSQLHADDGLLVADDIYASEALGMLRWRRADGLWRVRIEDPAGSLVVENVRLTIHARDRR